MLKNLIVWLKGIRVHQWSKNLLLFIPLFLAHEMDDPEKLLAALIAFISFSLCASGGYILNDLLDLKADQLHPSKKYRPLASGAISFKMGVILIPILLGMGFFLALFYLPLFFVKSLVLYFLVSLLYSVYLKKLLLVDVLVLAGLYTLRIIAGAHATRVLISPWLLAFSMFFFISLAFVKRFSELALFKEEDKKVANRNYLGSDKTLLASGGTAAGFISVLIFILYINSGDVVRLYHHPFALWFIAPFLLYWVTRIWFLAHRGKMNDDPIAFAIRDPISYMVGSIIAFLIHRATG
ncbi:MAG TPA: UbiA family prenyltransferase [Deltaproteobacteria bacterium]|nr:MAG: hypothetical protein A2048_02870 [Deltaproteobacteria bacterium GWA2_45_12]HBF13278.1 UbiA family prenyltransferase [Deltaproteobacteria bacterium]